MERCFKGNEITGEGSPQGNETQGDTYPPRRQMMKNPMGQHEHAKEMSHSHHKHGKTHVGYGSTDAKEMHEANEPKSHMGGMNIIQHTEHMEDHHEHFVHHFGSHGKGHKS
jgi:hypothetical protein